MSPHGGKREGAGRKAAGEKRTMNLCGVRVTPTQMAAYKAVAASAGLTLTTWVTLHLDAVVIEGDSIRWCDAKSNGDG